MRPNKKAKKSRTKQEWGERFTMNEVHLHFTCKCCYSPSILMDEIAGIVDIPVRQKCPHCRVGTTVEVIIGCISCETDGKCKDPDCTCTEVHMRIPIPQFMSFLKKV